MKSVEPQVLNGHVAPVRRDKRRRYTFRFMLDVMHDNQLLLAEELDELKRQRKYTSTILNALSLFQDLKKGSTKLLRQMFPGIVQSIESEYAMLHKPVIDVASLEERIRGLEQRLIAQVIPALPTPAPAGPKLLNIPKVDAPTFDDDDMPALSIKKDTSTNSAGNFLSSLSALAGSAFVDAPPDDGKSARENFTAGLGDMFGGDDDEWDE